VKKPLLAAQLREVDRVLPQEFLVGHGLVSDSMPSISACPRPAPAGAAA
jgi:hypothetical protein